MYKSTLHIYPAFIAILTVVVLSGLCHGDQASYQVSLYIHLHPKGPPMHICNGAVIQTRLVLTSASCLYYQFMPNSPMMAIHPKMISVVAGSTDAFSDAPIFQVSAINILNTFNESTLENDLAIVRLSEPLPLGFRDDIQWIILDDYKSDEKLCLANFYVRTSLYQNYGFTQTEELPILETELCETDSMENKREYDICSQYTLPLGFDCKSFEGLLHFNEDRGTGLICRNRLIAVLSTILPLDVESSKNCSEMTVRAIYTNVGQHMEWIYDIIAQEEYTAIMQGNYSSSMAYHEREAGAIKQSKEKNINESTTIVVTGTGSTDITTAGTTETIRKGPTMQASYYYLNTAARTIENSHGGRIFGLLALSLFIHLK